MQIDEPQPLRGLAILVVEDEIVFRQQLVTFLSRKGASVTGVEDGVAALQAIGQHPFDAIILDIQMPRLNGIQLLEQLQGYSGCIVAISGKSTLNQLRKVMQLGASDFLVKPLADYNELVETLLTSVASIDDTHLQLEFAEFAEHKSELSSNDQLSSRLLRDILPPSPIEALGYFCHYKLRGHTLFPIIKVIDQDSVAFIIVDICLSGADGVVAAALINGYFQDCWSRLISAQDKVALEPSRCLSELNNIIQAAGIKAPVGCLYGLHQPKQVLFSNAGILDVPKRFSSVHPGLGLGLQHNAVYQDGRIPRVHQDFTIHLQNIAGDRVDFKFLFVG